MSIRTLLSALGGLLRIARGIGAVILLVTWPIRWLGKGIYAFAMLPAYRYYRIGRTKFNRVIAPAKSRWLFFVLHRNTVAAAIALVAVFIAINNVQAKASDSVNFGRKSVFGSLFHDTLSEETEVVEGPVASGNVKEKETVAALTPTTEQSARPAAKAESASSGEQQLALGIGGTGEGEADEAIRYYIVEGGDTVSSIAAQFNLSTSTVLSANQLGENDFIKPGQKLTILPVDGVAHTVKKGDTVASIAKKYKTDEEKILSFNRLASADALNEGEEILVPGGSLEVAPTPQPTTSTASPQRTLAIIKVPPAARVSGKRMQWPTAGHRINQYFKFRHTGLDIDGDYSSPIYAADSGVVESVIYARYGYGFHIIINHGGGRETLYGHASKIFVKPGQSVRRGQSIAMVGSTGRSTGTHLHFEVIVNGAKRNPLSYL
ncbi:MAG: M23 family metallopeptidase [Patescibacteria group bacterium]